MANLQKIKEIALAKQIPLRRVCERAGLSVYWARHSWATIAANDLGLPMDTISRALGHSTGAKVTAVYVDYDLRKVDEAVERMERWVLEGKK